MYRFLLILFVFVSSCSNTNNAELSINSTKKDSVFNLKKNSEIIYGNEQSKIYLPLLNGKTVAVAANQTSFVESENLHLVDFLIKKNINIKKIFAPEHGFRGNADRGKKIENSTDSATGIEIVSLFGKNKKPSPEILKDIEIIIFDIQDAGARFYTYISSMHYLMEACAENNIKFMVLDRPNPLGDYFDGPVLKKEFSSFVGMHQMPIVHGLTIGELALMINGEKWLKGGIQCELEVIKMKNYSHKIIPHIKIKPSPNLPNDISIRLYPSLCLFEATEISVGRGTEFPFQIIGFPDTVFGKFNFIPQDIEGMQMNPEQENKICYGLDLRNEKIETKFTLKYLIYFYNKFPDKNNFISRKDWFNKLAGNSELQNQILSGMSETEIRKTWEKDLNDYKKMREKYLLY
jgi:uncharacterized protein YbbC (DUF1343 family)